WCARRRLCAGALGMSGGICVDLARPRDAGARGGIGKREAGASAPALGPPHASPSAGGAADMEGDVVNTVQLVGRIGSVFKEERREENGAAPEEAVEDDVEAPSNGKAAASVERNR